MNIRTSLVLLFFLLFDRTGLSETSNGKIIYIAKSKKAFVINLGEKDGIQTGDRVCFTLKGLKKLYCPKVLKVKENVSIVRSSQKISTLLKKDQPISRLIQKRDKGTPNNTSTEDSESKQEDSKQEEPEQEEPEQEESEQEEEPQGSIERSYTATLKSLGFLEERADEQRKQNINTMTAQASMNYTSADEINLFSLKLRASVDDDTEKKSWVDTEEAEWTTYSEHLEFKLGIGKVFWGVNESNHLVDIINQTNPRDDLELQGKLGQPMARLTSTTDNLILSVYALPYFRERPLFEKKERFALGLEIEDATYESREKDRHTDIALRLQHNFLGLDLSWSFFSGTSREPTLVVNTETITTPQGAQTIPVSITPYYPLMSQAGLELQYIYNSISFKAELAEKQYGDFRYFSHVSGIEYTFFGAPIKQADTTLYLEFSKDGRGEDASVFLENDYFLGLRFNMNDPSATILMVGGYVDEKTSSTYTQTKLERRFGNNFKAFLIHRKATVKENDKLESVKNDNHVELKFSYYY